MPDRLRNVKPRDVAAHWEAIFKAAVRLSAKPTDSSDLIDAVENYVTYNMDHGYVEERRDV